MRHCRWSTGTVAALLVVGCAGSQGGIDVVHPEVATGRESVAVEVINEHFYDARLYALYVNGERYPLGTVPGNSTAGPITIPWRPRTLTVEVHMIIAGGAYLSDGVDVEPGDLVQIRLPPNIESSGFFRPLPR